MPMYKTINNQFFCFSFSNKVNKTDSLL